MLMSMRIRPTSPVVRLSPFLLSIQQPTAAQKNRISEASLVANSRASTIGMIGKVPSISNSIQWLNKQCTVRHSCRQRTPLSCVNIEITRSSQRVLARREIVVMDPLERCHSSNWPTLILRVLNSLVCAYSLHCALTKGTLP